MIRICKTRKNPWLMNQGLRIKIDLRQNALDQKSEGVNALNQATTQAMPQYTPGSQSKQSEGYLRFSPWAKNNKGGKNGRN